MKDDTDPLLVRMNRLLELQELARHAAPEDRARIHRTISLRISAKAPWRFGSNRPPFR
jgi:hypothetical protein